MSTEAGGQHFMRAFSDPEAVAKVCGWARRSVPGYADLHRMTAILLGERAPRNAKVLVLGAGGGLELKAPRRGASRNGRSSASIRPRPCLTSRRVRSGTSARASNSCRVTSTTRRSGPDDAATCLLTLHFPRYGRGANAPPARFNAGSGPARLLSPRTAAFRKETNARSGSRVTRHTRSRRAWSPSTPTGRAGRGGTHGKHVLSPEQGEAVLRDAGLRGDSQFFAAFTWRGWIAHA